MTKWKKLGAEIDSDWYEIRCQLDKSNQLQLYLDGLQKRKKFYLDFGEILLYNAIDEGWDLNSGDFVDNFDTRPLIDNAILVELFESSLQRKLAEATDLRSVHHYQVLGINFGIDIICKGIPVIKGIGESKYRQE